ncbi:MULTISPECIES: methylenetetrahydrofolate reductase [Campylobacter]|uniref:Methylenetetrahydrofolate reductase n=1 Tax=Campylobacter vicugnae TaxID=1660076 RepID=A0ABZ2E9Q2_9BACT|nr:MULTISPECIES: methylenetetrahydrofolate reductase [unclassified Campylobacter]ARR03934.1 methylenetetrahydrofolate reductase family protein [Campylobacter sp. RM12175]MCR8689905.1 methylenetetrahydrofolate reductase [Campylobacter sp. RM9264]MCR8700497.1 methylenetetrahydrofolate reductase [Campylobacter sp. RM12176]
MLKTKIKQGKSGIVLYGLTPPKISLSHDEAKEIALRQLSRLDGIKIDGLVIYDLQDESNRNSSNRTFEFVRTIKPEIYAKDYLQNRYEAVIYKAVGNYNETEFKEFLQTHSDAISIFVGASSAIDTPKLSLNDAYKMKKEIANDLTLGGICIPERHTKKQDEDLRVASKRVKGCEFFITQAVYDIETAKKFLDDFAALGIKNTPIIFTFTPCGNEKTYEFMQWLGISVSNLSKNRIFDSDDALESSVKLSLDMFEFLYKYGTAKGVSVGANIESISTRKVEIDASIRLLKGIIAIVEKNSLENTKSKIQSASRFDE